ncbi:MAG TPA: WD40 repeat domain-containing serine/threonine-protein kinase, partial [Gemmataceae bacterium]|nr:WD40 repeat domain-containing serine/threonine-protein kinase [Gemmataceae bacterium]
MTDKRHCTRCQAELPEGAPGNRCPKCLLEIGLSDDVEEIGDSRPAAGPPAALHAMEKPGDRIGRYQLLQQIGQGACGLVYLAEQQEPVRRRVALKIIKLGMDTKSVIARFEAEQQALALMEHPNIAQVLDAGTTETGRLYFVMELVRGIKITEYCDENHLSTTERLTLFTQVCRAIQHAHQKGVIHRDLKPSNILVTINDGVAVPKVIDFGIAKATNQQPLSDKTVFTAFDQFIGTPAYMSPEQALMTSLDIDTRSDIYSLGVLLYDLLTGRTPFEAGDLLKSGLDEMRRTIREKEPAKPSTRLRTLLEPELTTTAERRRTDPSRLLNTLRGDLDWIVMKALEKDRTRRYETANGLARDIQRHLNNEPVMARPPSTLYRFRKMVRRNKLAFAAGAAVVAALVIGFGVATWFLIRTLAAERQQTSLREQAERAEQGKTEELARTLLAVARASRQTGEPGRRFASLEAIAKAAAIRPSLELRNEAIAALALTDLGPARFGRDTPWTGTHSAGLATAFDSELRRVALFAQDGSIYVHRVADHAELLHIPPAETNRIAEDILLMFSPDDRHLAARYHDGAVRCWQLEPLRLRIDARPRSEFMFSFAFSPDSRWLLAGESSQELYVYSLAEAWPSATTDAPMSRPARILKLSIQPDLIAFDPTGTRLAISGGTPVQILKWPGGELLRSFSDMNRISSSIWHPDSRQLFVGTWQGTIDVLDSLQPSSRSLAGHHPVVNWLALHPRGDVLASHSWDGTTKLWEMAAAVPSLSTEEGLALRFSSDGRRLGFHHGTHRYGVWPVALSRVFRSLAGVSTPRDRASLDFTPDGRVLLWADQFGLWWADLHEGAYDHRKVPGLSYARFNADATAVLLAGDGGLKRWSLRESSSSGSTGLQLAGEAEPLGTNHFPLSWPMHVPPNRSLMIAAEESSPAFQNRVLIMDAGGGQRVIHSPEDARVFYTALSPDERWLALGHYIGSTYVLDARNGATV